MSQSKQDIPTPIATTMVLGGAAFGFFSILRDAAEIARARETRIVLTLTPNEARKCLLELTGKLVGLPKEGAPEAVADSIVQSFRNAGVPVQRDTGVDAALIVQSKLPDEPNVTVTVRVTIVSRDGHRFIDIGAYWVGGDDWGTAQALSRFEKQRNLALTCRICKQLAYPIPRTGHRYKCINCGNQFANTAHDFS